ncbi:MAG: YybH family protein [Gemmatimonadaceae bacterium]
MLACTVLAACANRDGRVELTQGERAATQKEVEQALRDGYDLSKPNVADRMVRLYAPTGRVVSASSGRASESRDSLVAGIRYFWENVGVNMREPRWVWDKLYVDVLSATAAVVTATYRIPHRNPRNEPHVLGGAMTAVFEKRDGRWVIVQEHLSDLPQLADSSTSGATPHDHH